MQTIHLRSRAGPDGVLKLSVPTGLANLELDVLVVMDPACPAPTEPQTWAEFIASTAGSIPDDTFVRHEQGILEVREELP